MKAYFARFLLLLLKEKKIFIIHHLALLLLNIPFIFFEKKLGIYALFASCLIIAEKFYGYLIREDEMRGFLCFIKYNGRKLTSYFFCFILILLLFLSPFFALSFFMVKSPVIFIICVIAQCILIFLLEFAKHNMQKAIILIGIISLFYLLFF
jgi:hypothetical protein